MLVVVYWQCAYTDGHIPYSLCKITTLSLNIEHNNIHCYDGCLTSAQISIIGATSICPDNNKIYLFISIISICTCISIICTVYYSKTHSTHVIIYKYNHYTAVISFMKLILVICLVLWIDDYWYYCTNPSNDSIESCTSVEYNQCNSYCNDISTVLVNEHDDVNGNHVTASGYCSANFDGNCACKYWQWFMFGRVQEIWFG